MPATNNSYTQRNGTTLLERLAHFTDRSGGADACWPYRRADGRHKTLSWDGKVLYAHRVAWEIANGRAVPEGQHVCHRCDNPPCVNPTHLFVGTQLDNMRDMIAKGRGGNAGVTNGMAKLTPDLVRAIRADTRTQQAIADDLGISRTLVSRVRSRHVWAHVVGLLLVAIFSPKAFAADWQMKICKPDQPCEVRIIYFDGGQIACATDTASVAIVMPKGTRIWCERAWKTTEAKR